MKILITTQLSQVGWSYLMEIDACNVGSAPFPVQSGSMCAKMYGKTNPFRTAIA
jgi:hypothetical protein